MVFNSTVHFMPYVLFRQKKVHLQTLRERSEVQKMTPRERMRLRKLQDADEKARKLKYDLNPVYTVT